MAKTVHIYPTHDGWAVAREGAKAISAYSSQKEAIENARVLTRNSEPSQMVVHGKDGRIRSYVTRGLPKVQDTPGGGRAAKRIESAVGRVVLRRMATSDPVPPRG